MCRQSCGPQKRPLGLRDWDLPKTTQTGQLVSIEWSMNSLSVSPHRGLCLPSHICRASHNVYLAGCGKIVDVLGVVGIHIKCATGLGELSL